MSDKRLIQQKLAEILKQLDNLEILSAMKSQELFGKIKNLYFAERVMERLIGAAIDINMHLATDLLEEMPKDYFSSFIILAKLKILPMKFAKRIAPSTSLRNILIHEYQKIDENKFFRALVRATTDYKTYAKYIDKWLK